ncbi:hypothetical protein [Rodentibacter haemolyticus]|uniref:Phage protein n=1 Tax=Rodentibacter haemolyticus TaxID=2778911 RepID=A0ABX6UYL6_9PAST|nr:hypothetical protein [Rodentibacter haemolyticus]QPB42181.1 hypothetical protein IHV77_09730 [Rodentibacter haemolyticus]
MNKVKVRFCGASRYSDRHDNCIQEVEYDKEEWDEMTEEEREQIAHEIAHECFEVSSWYEVVEDEQLD